MFAPTFIGGDTRPSATAKVSNFIFTDDNFERVFISAKTQSGQSASPQKRNLYEKIFCTLILFVLQKAYVPC